MGIKSFIHLVLLERSNRFLVLLISLILFFALYPILEKFFLAELILNLFFMLILLSGVLVIAKTRKPFIILSILAISIVTLRWIDYFNPIESLAIIGNSMNIVFWVYITVDILKFILRQKIITSELINAALAVYFIIGLAWASIYELLEFGRPGSFSLQDPEGAEQKLIFQLWYFSMVTLTTLGYGDIAPVTMSARVFVVLEAIMGQFYLAVLIASLIGRRVAQEKT